MANYQITLRMRKYLLTLAVLFTATFTLTAFKPEKKTAELKWLGWNEGYALAKKNKKILLVDCYTEWCGWCKKMDRDTYANEDVIKKINADYVPVKFNPELEATYDVGGKKLNGPQLLNLLSNGNHQGYPSTYFIANIGTKDETIDGSAVGYYDAERFGKVLDALKVLKK